MAPTLFVSIASEEKRLTRTLDNRNTGGESLQPDRKRVNNIMPMKKDVDHSLMAQNSSFMCAPGGQMFGAERYAKILKQQIDYIGAKRGKQARKLINNPSKNHLPV